MIVLSCRRIWFWVNIRWDDQIAHKTPTSDYCGDPWSCWTFFGVNAWKLSMTINSREHGKAKAQKGVSHVQKRIPRTQRFVAFARRIFRVTFRPKLEMSQSSKKLFYFYVYEFLSNSRWRRFSESIFRFTIANAESNNHEVERLHYTFWYVISEEMCSKLVKLVFSKGKVKRDFCTVSRKINRLLSVTAFLVA